MALNFPLNPSDQDTFENYVYDATNDVWNLNPYQIAARFVTSATAPTSPSEGDGWFDTNTAKSYIYYDSVWVQVGALGSVTLDQIGDINAATPTDGQALLYDSATSTWVNSDIALTDPIKLNGNTISSNYSIPTGYNGLTAGPVTIADGVTVTISDGSAWSIV